MTNGRNEFERIKKSALETLESAKTAEDVEMLRLKYLGRKGALNLILRGLKNLPDAERRTLGAEANAFRAALESKIGEALENSKADEKHPRFSKERPEIETEHYNFDALNIPAEHPARDMWDTFWLRQNEIKIQSAGRRTKLKNNERLLLRTHTSPVQIRYMETHEPPIRIISPGIVYRYEATDASHDIEFWQIEGLMVDKDVSAANFKAVIERFFSELFRRVVSIRLRPSYFPFVEPGFEVDISCAQCKGKGCSICGQSGWLEMMGAGMVHPNVFKAVGYNPSPLAGGVQGFAFGMGLDRIAMMKYKIPDISLMRSGDLRFLDQL